MQRPKTIETDHSVELIENAVEVIHDVVSRIPHVAGVEADPEELVVVYAIDDAGELLKAPTHLGPLARHGLQKNRGAHPGLYRSVEPLDDELDAPLGTLLHVAAGMEVVVVAGKHLHTLKVVSDGSAGKINRLGLCGTEIHGVRRVGDELPEAVCLHQRTQSGDVIGVDGPGFAASRVSRKEGEGRGTYGKSGFSHGFKPARGGQVTSHIQVAHGLAPPQKVADLIEHDVGDVRERHSLVLLNTISRNHGDAVRVGAEGRVGTAHVVGDNGVSALACQLSLRVGD